MNTAPVVERLSRRFAVVIAAGSVMLIMMGVLVGSGALFRLNGSA